MLFASESLQILENRIAFGMAGILGAKVRGVGEHRHDLFLDRFRIIGQIDAIAHGFAHLEFAIRSRQTPANRIPREKDFGFGEHLFVSGVELMGDFRGLLDHRGLVFARGNDGRAEREDIRGLGNRIGQETDRDALAEFANRELAFHRGVAYEARIGDEIHEIAREFEELGNAGLNEKSDFGGVNSRGKVIERDLDHVIAHLLDIPGVIRKGLGIRDHDVHFVKAAFVLQGNPLAEGSHIMADVEFSRRTVARQHNGGDFLFFFHVRFSFREQILTRASRKCVRIPLLGDFSFRLYNILCCERII